MIKKESIPKILESAVYSDCTHLLKCKHCIGKNCSNYYMDCIPLGIASNGKMKVIVFGERDWKNKEHIKKIRYVDPSKVFLENKT